MDKYQEALNCFTECWGCTKPEYYNDVMNKTRIREERIELLQKLVDKATPKKLKNYRYFVGDCSNCGRAVIEDQEYCDQCGQKLDWSKEDD